MKKISRAQYEKGVDEHYENMRKEGIPYTRQIRLGLWEIFDGNDTIVTGDGGYKVFNQALRDAVNREIKKIKQDIQNID